MFSNKFSLSLRINSKPTLMIKNWTKIQLFFHVWKMKSEKNMMMLHIQDSNHGFILYANILRSTPLVTLFSIIQSSYWKRVSTATFLPDTTGIYRSKSFEKMPKYLVHFLLLKRRHKKQTEYYTLKKRCITLNFPLSPLFVLSWKPIKSTRYYWVRTVGDPHIMTWVLFWILAEIAFVLCLNIIGLHKENRKKTRVNMHLAQN